MSEDESTSLLILRDLIKPEKEFETHISHVLIKNDDVYKLKKQVDFGFLNFKLPKDRKRFCILEKKLNERFSENIYEDTLKIVRQGENFALVPVSNSLTAVDYVVKMKRIPDEDFLAQRIINNEISADKARNIGSQIAELFSGIETSAEIAEEYNGYETVKLNCLENFEQTLRYSGNIIDSNKYDYIKKMTLTFLEHNKDIIKHRTNDGFVKDGHGDLRLEHVYFNGENVGLIDCIEFNRRLRYNDVISDFVFLCTELDQEGLYELSDSFLEGFLSVYSDKNSKALINFYKCYRAFVRLKIACFMLDGKGREWEEYNNKKAEAERFLDLSFTYALNIFEPKTIIFSGLMGTGKSKNGRAFSSKYPSVILSTDYYRKLNAGISPERNVYDDFSKGLYSQENTLKTYEYLGKTADHKKDLGRMVIVDGSFSKKIFLEKFSDGHTFNLHRIDFTADESEILRRLEKRRDGKNISDGRPELYEKQRSNAEPVAYDLRVDTTYSKVEDNLEKITDYLMNET